MDQCNDIAIVRRFWAKGSETSDTVDAYETVSAYLTNRYGSIRHIDDHLLENPHELFSEGIRLIVVPAQRYFYESRFEGLIKFAELGGSVLATYPSFWKTEKGEIVIDSRLRRLFGVDNVVLDRVVEGTIDFSPSMETWLYDGLPEEIHSRLDASGGWGWGWIVTSSREITEGEWHITNAYEWVSEERPKQPDPTLSGKSSSPCLVRRWDNQGRFIYLCFHYGVWLREDPRLGRLMENIVTRVRSMSKPANDSGEQPKSANLTKQLEIYRILLAAAVLVIGLLISRLFFTSSAFADIAKSLMIGVLSGIATYVVTKTIGRPTDK